MNKKTISKKLFHLFGLIILIVFGFCINTLNAATINSKSITANWLTASAWVGGVVPTQSDVAVIVAGANFTINGNISVGSVQVNSGGTLNAGAATINLYDNWLINGTFNRGTSTVVFSGNASQSINGSTAIKFQNIINNNANGGAGMGVTANNTNTTIYGNFEQNGVFNRNSTGFPNVKVTFAGTTIISGTTSLILHNIDILAGATLNGATGISGGSFDMYFTGHWNNLGTFVPGTGTVIVQYVSSYATQNITPGGSPFYNFKINKAVNVAPQNNIVVQNNFTILQGTWVAGALNLNVGGDFSNAGTFTAGTGKVIFDGTAAQKITTGGSSLHDFTINKATGSTFQGSNVKVTNNLSLTSGILYTYDTISTIYEMYVSNNNSGTSITGGTSTEFVVGNLKRKVVAGLDTYVFPIGVLNTSPAIYRPVTYNQTTSGGAAWVNMVADTFSSVTTAKWFVGISTDTLTPTGTITLPYDLTTDFPAVFPECILSIIQGQAVPASNFNYVLTTTTPAAGGSAGSISAAIPTNLNPFGFIIGEPLPVSTGTTICSGTSATLMVNFPNGRTHFNWYDSITAGNLLVLNNPMLVTPNLTANTTYYVEYYDSITMCASTRVPVTIAVTSAFISTFSLPDSICRGENTLITFSGTVSTTATYYWDFDGGILISGSGPSNQVVYWNDPGFKNVTLTINASPCNSSLTLNTVNVMVAPTPAVITSNAYAICAGDSVILSATGSVGGDSVTYTFYDSITGGNIVGTPPLTVIPSKTTTYYLEVMNEHGCKSGPVRDSITITVYPAPNLQSPYVEGGVIICYGTSTSIHVFVDSLPTANIYWWDSQTGGTFISSNDSIFTPVLYRDTVFWVEAISIHGCTNQGGRFPVNVIVEQLPFEVLQTNLEYNTVYVGQQMIVTANPANYSIYQFYLNNQLVQADSNNTYSSYSFHNGDVIKVSAISNLQCQGPISDSLKIKVIPIANAFTPNGDGINDVFLKGIDLIVMNRWGQELYRGTEGWDGTYKGTKASPGTYYFIIKITGPDKTPITQTGPITVVDE